jgi:acetyl-CoA carboxylase biotin carboxyl carrier protein
MSRDVHVLRVRAASDGISELLAPSVGVFAPSVAVGQLVCAGQSVGTIDVLGILRELVVPDGVAGRVVQCGGGRSRLPVQYGEALLQVSAAAVAEASSPSAESGSDASGAVSFVAPMSGRFYSRPSPNDPAFVEAGDEVKHGQTVGLLEVMKTFNRLVYQGDTMPASAIIERIVPADGDDVVRGDPILVLG